MCLTSHWQITIRASLEKLIIALSWWDQRKMHNVFSSLSIFALYMLDSDCRPASNWRPTLKSMSDLYITDMYLKSRSLTIQNFYHDTYRSILDKWQYVSRYILWHFVYLCVRHHFFLLRICHIHSWKLKLIFERKKTNIYVAKQILI